MPQVLVQLLDSCQDPEVNIQAIAKIVDKDAALCAKVLQLVNSAFIGARTAIRNIDQAVVYLGLDTVRNLAISVSVQQVFRRVETNGLLSMDRFWHHSYTNALIAQNIAKTVHYPDHSEAYLTGLLHDIGKLLLWMAFPGSYAPLLLKGVRCHNARLAFLEEEKLHVNHCQAGAWLCQEWRLPTVIGDAIRFHHHGIDEVRQSLPLTKIVYLADLLSHDEPDTAECVEAADKLFGLPPKAVAALVEGIDEQIEELAQQLGIRIPRLTKTSHDKEPESEENHRETSLGLIKRVREISQLSGILDNLLRAEDRGQIVLAIEQGVKMLFNEDRCLLLLADGPSGGLAVATSPENRLARETTGLLFRTGDSPDSLLAQAMRTSMPTHYLPATKAQPSGNLFDVQLLHLLRADGMIILPFTCRKHCEGLLVIGLQRQSIHSLKGQTSALELMTKQAAVALQLERTRRQQTAQIIKERLQAATLVARKIGHEINNPLAILRNYLHILERKVSNGQELQEELTIISEEMDRIARITRGLDDLSQEGNPPHFETVDLQQVLEKTLAPFRAALPPENKIQLVLDNPEPALQLNVDPGLLQQILHNLIKNALEAITDQGRITVQAKTENRRLHIQVEDDGPGIPTQQQGELFNAGFSTKNSAHRGLGLSISASLARQMQASLQCTSTAGKTIFTLSFPLESS